MTSAEDSNNIFPHEKTRVKLKGLKTDYMKASRVEMPGLEKKLILTAAPRSFSKEYHSILNIISAEGGRF